MDVLGPAVGGEVGAYSLGGVPRQSALFGQRPEPEAVSTPNRQARAS
jgi:hypothetical protein